MSFGGGSKSSSSTSTSIVDETTSNVDNRAGDNGIFGGNVTLNPGDIGGNVSISTVDYGAVKGGVDIALEGLGVVRDANATAKSGLTDALAAVKSVASDSIGQAYGLANEARQSETSGAINTFLKYAVWVAIAGIAVYGINAYRAR